MELLYQFYHLPNKFILEQWQYIYPTLVLICIFIYFNFVNLFTKIPDFFKSNFDLLNDLKYLSKKLKIYFLNMRRLISVIIFINQEYL